MHSIFLRATKIENAIIHILSWQTFHFKIIDGLDHEGARYIDDCQNQRAFESKRDMLWGKWKSPGRPGREWVLGYACTSFKLQGRMNGRQLARLNRESRIRFAAKICFCLPLMVFCRSNLGPFHSHPSGMSSYP